MADAARGPLRSSYAQRTDYIAQHAIDAHHASVTHRDLRTDACELYELVQRLERLLQARAQLHRYIQFETARLCLIELDAVISEVQNAVRQARIRLGMSPERRDYTSRR